MPEGLLAISKIMNSAAEGEGRALSQWLAIGGKVLGWSRKSERVTNLIQTKTFGAKSNLSGTQNRVDPGREAFERNYGGEARGADRAGSRISDGKRAKEQASPLSSFLSMCIGTFKHRTRVSDTGRKCRTASANF